MTPDQLVAKLKILRSFSFTQANFREFAQIAAEERKKGFMRGEGPDGEKWAPLDPKTIEKKSGTRKKPRPRQKNSKGNYRGMNNARKPRVASRPSSPLIDTADLMIPTTSATSREGRVVLAKSRSNDVWQGKSISDIHDEGTDRIPRRRHWAIYINAEKRIRARAEYLFEEEVKKLF